MRTIESVIIRVVRDEDFGAYLEWVDYNGDPVITDPSSTARMQVRNKDDDSLVLSLEEGGDTTVDPVVRVYSEASVVRITIPRTISNALQAGVYKYDIMIDVASPVDPDGAEAVFATPQRHRVLKGDFVVENPVTQETT